MKSLSALVFTCWEMGSTCLCGTHTGPRCVHGMGGGGFNPQTKHQLRAEAQGAVGLWGTVVRHPPGAAHGNTAAPGGVSLLNDTWW